MKKANCRLQDHFQESPEVLLQLLTPAWGREVFHYSLSSILWHAVAAFWQPSQPLRGLGFERSSSGWQRTCNLMGIEHDSGHRYWVKIRQVRITLSSRRNPGKTWGSYVLARLSLHAVMIALATGTKLFLHYALMHPRASGCRISTLSLRIPFPWWGRAGFALSAHSNQLEAYNRTFMIGLQCLQTMHIAYYRPQRALKVFSFLMLISWQISLN